MKESIIEFLKNSEQTYFTVEDLFEQMDLELSLSGEFYNCLEDLVDESELIKTKKSKYALIESSGFLKGVFNANKGGFGFITPITASKTDYYVPAHSTNTALDKDVVLFKDMGIDYGRASYNDAYTKPEASVVKVIKRSHDVLVGEFHRHNEKCHLIPDDPKIFTEIIIKKDKTLEAKNGQKVVAKVIKWPDMNNFILAEVVEILGFEGDYGVDLLGIMRRLKIADKFPDNVLRRAEKLDKEVSEADKQGRVDFRSDLVVTIDGHDAKDIDDAISIKLLPNMNYKLDVHIADVAHYVREDSDIDKEALNRATSVYLIDKVIPMLPKELSNVICSLNEGVDRLCMTCSMEIDPKGNIVSHEILESIIRSKHRMNYTDVSDMLEGVDRPELEKYDYMRTFFELMQELALILRHKREADGSIDFDFKESQIDMDEEGNILDIYPRERRIANKIIEEFMLCANKVVAEHVFWQNIPFVYRVHDKPNPEKIMAFNRYLHNLGISIKGKLNNIHPKAIAQVLHEIEGRKEEKVLNKMMLRSLKKAKYSPICSGHFGLAFDYYCHFTAPIRRYPDLQIHRILKEMIHGELDSGRIDDLVDIVRYASEKSSEMELIADEAEREVENMRKAQYMSEFIGEEYDAIITSVMSFGIFVELENTVEGMVHISTLDGFYEYDESTSSLQSYSGTLYSIGDEVRVRLMGVDVDRREIDFIILTEKQLKLEEKRKRISEELEANREANQKRKEKIVATSSHKSNEKVVKSAESMTKKREKTADKEYKSNSEYKSEKKRKGEKKSKKKKKAK